MLAWPAVYTHLKQQTFKNNSDGVRINLDPFKRVLGFPVETILTADTKLSWYAVTSLMRGTQRHLAAISGGGHPAQGLWTELQPPGEFLVFWPVYICFCQKILTWIFVGAVHIWFPPIHGGLQTPPPICRNQKWLTIPPPFSEIILFLHSN